MFNLIFESIQAYNQVGFFIGALIFLGLGGFILGNAFYWRIHALRASGTIIGVIANKGVYVPVYRYALEDGQTHLAKSNTGSSSVQGKETGRIVPLMISAHNPTDAQEANSYLFDIIGIVFFVPGLWLAYTALTAYPITRMTWIMAAAMLVYLAERGYRTLIGCYMVACSIDRRGGRLGANPLSFVRRQLVFRLIELMRSSPARILCGRQAPRKHQFELSVRKGRMGSVGAVYCRRPVGTALAVHDRRGRLGSTAVVPNAPRGAHWE
jgi:hypothetical protein